jgi:hypothetical protein
MTLTMLTLWVLINSQESPEVRSVIPLTITPSDTQPSDPTPDPTELAFPNHSMYLGYLLWESPGRLIGSSSTPVPTGVFTSVTGYTVEEVTLPAPTNFSSIGLEGKTIEKLWRVSIIRDKPFQIRAVPLDIWLNNVPLRECRIFANRFTCLVLDPSILREGSAIMYGFSDVHLTLLPEPLHISIAP